MQNFPFAFYNNLQQGDVLICRGRMGVKHFVVYLGMNNLGQHFYADNTLERGVQFLYEWKFLHDNDEILGIRRLDACQQGRKEAIARARSLWGKKYRLTKFNCEHFANYVQFNIPFSMQVKKGGNIAAVCVVVAMVAGAFGQRRSA